jgi:hypothetical protein
MRIPPTIPLAIWTLASVGCRSNDLEFAREALRRQADQNQAMATLQREVAVGARELVARDADANRRLADVHAQLHQERASLSADWRELESNRQREAFRSRRDSFLSALVRGGAATAAALFALAIVRATYNDSPRSGDDELTALLLDYLTPTESDVIAATRNAPERAAPVATFLTRLPHRPFEDL